jgi:hypothetical protein
LLNFITEPLLLVTWLPRALVFATLLVIEPSLGKELPEMLLLSLNLLLLILLLPLDLLLLLLLLLLLVPLLGSSCWVVLVVLLLDLLLLLVPLLGSSCWVVLVVLLLDLLLMLVLLLSLSCWVLLVVWPCCKMWHRKSSRHCWTVGSPRAAFLPWICH